MVILPFCVGLGLIMFFWRDWFNPRGLYGFDWLVFQGLGVCSCIGAVITRVSVESVAIKDSRHAGAGRYPLLITAEGNSGATIDQPINNPLIFIVSF
jgi:hypothetical protein